MMASFPEPTNYSRSYSLGNTPSEGFERNIHHLRFGQKTTGSLCTRSPLNGNTDPNRSQPTATYKMLGSAVDQRLELWRHVSDRWSRLMSPLPVQLAAHQLCC